MTKKAIGRRFSKREVEVIQIEGHEAHFERIDWDDVWSVATIERHRQHARAVLESEGVDVPRFLDDSPHGSALRDYVLNDLGREPDSRAGLAARIFEMSSHILAYLTMEGGNKLIPGLAHRLGRLVLLAKAYEVDSVARRESAQKPRPNRRDPLRDEIVAAFRHCRIDGLTLKESMISLCNNGHSGLTFRDMGDSYRVSRDAPDGELTVKEYSLPNLEALFTEAGKK